MADRAQIASGLYAEVTTADGAVYRFDADAKSVGSRPLNLTFSTTQGEGFGTASFTLARRIDRDWPDLTLLDDWKLIGADGSIAYQGRLSAMPRDLGDTHSISVTLTGWMAHATDQKFTEIYVDRDLGAWGDIPTTRRYTLLNLNLMPQSPSSQADVDSNEAAILTQLEGSWVSPYTPVAEAWYDAGAGNLIGKVAYRFRKLGGVGSAAPWTVSVITSTDQTGSTSISSTGNVVGGGNPYSSTLTAATPARYAYLQFLFNTTPAGTDGVQYPVYWSNMAVYGVHGLTTYSGDPTQPDGVRASDVIRDIAKRWAPLINTDGVQDTSYVIQNLTFKDPVTPYDAWLQVNAFHSYHLGVWENRTLHFRPYDLSDYDWQVRLDDLGVRFSAQGESTQDFFNGVNVTYTNLLTGKQDRLLAKDYPAQLMDPDPLNPWTTHGIHHPDELQLSSPILTADALVMAQTMFRERNRPKAPGTIQVAGGYVLDRAGTRQPAWKVRAGDTIAITDFPNDAPRLITETSWSESGLSITVDAPPMTVDAVVARISNALTARGLS